MDTYNTETADEAAPLQTSARRTVRERYSTRMRRLSQTALNCLESILTDDTAKAADRIAAAKLALDAASKQASPTRTAGAEDGALTVVFEGMPTGYAD